MSFRKRLSAALAPITLRAILGFSEADDLRRFDVCVHLTRFIRAKWPRLSQFVRRVSLDHHAFTGSILPTTLVRETANFRILRGSKTIHMPPILHHIRWFFSTPARATLLPPGNCALYRIPVLNGLHHDYQ